MYHQYQDSIGERLHYEGGLDNPQFQEGFHGGKNPYAKGSISYEYFQLGVLHKELKELEALGPIEM